MTFFCTCPVYCPVLSVFACCAVSVIDHLAVQSAFVWTRNELTRIIKLFLFVQMDIHVCRPGYGWTPKESWIDSRHRKVRLLFSKSRKFSSGPPTSRHLKRHWPLCPGIKRPGREADQLHLGQRWGYENVHLNLHFPICLHSMQMNFAFTSTAAHTRYAVQRVTVLKETQRQRKLVCADARQT